MLIEPSQFAQTQVSALEKEWQKGCSEQSVIPVPPLFLLFCAFHQNKGFVRTAKAKPLAFDPGLAQNLFEDFAGSDFLKAV